MIKGSSSAYIDALLRCYPPDEIHMGKAVQSIGNDEGQLWLQTAAGTAHFDNIILATSATEALQILGDGITKEEREILSSFQTISNVVVLHSDISVFSSCIFGIVA
jgi:predicted NAD/FAD-binding protein